MLCRTGNHTYYFGIFWNSDVDNAVNSRNLLDTLNNHNGHLESWCDNTGFFQTSNDNLHSPYLGNNLSIVLIPFDNDSGRCCRFL